MGINIWFHKGLQKEYTAIYEYQKQKYKQINELLFQDHEKAADEYFHLLEQQNGNQYDWDVVDPSSIYEDMHSETYDFYLFEQLMEHNQQLLMLSNAFQIFEQQIRLLIYRESKNNLFIQPVPEFEKFATTWSVIKKLYLDLGYDIQTNLYWEDIEVLQYIVNTFKHGPGESSIKLKGKRPELFLKKDDVFFKDGAEYVIDIENTSALEPVFDFEVLSIDYYLDALTGFWTEFPEHLPVQQKEELPF